MEKIVYPRGVYNGKVLAKLFLSDTLVLSSAVSSNGGAEASSDSISRDIGRRRIRVVEDGRLLELGALTRDCNDARCCSSSLTVD